MTPEERAAWKAERDRIPTVGGSTIANVLGRGRRTAAAEYRILRGEQAPDPETLAMRRGRALEPLILEEYQRDTGRELIQLPRPGIIRHPKYPWAAASFDAITRCDRVAEAKAWDFARGFGEPGTDQVPDDVLLQTQWYLWIAEAYYGRPFPEGDPIVLPAGADHVRIYCVRADPELHEIMREAGAAFIDCVVRGTPPEEAEPISLRIDGVERVAVRADERAAATCSRLVELAPQLASLEQEKEDLRDYLKAYIGLTATELVDALGRTLATSRPSKPGIAVDMKALAAAHPDIVAKFTKTKAGARPLLIK